MGWTGTLFKRRGEGCYASISRGEGNSFVDGNKRIAATLFLCFIHNNGILYRPDGIKRIADGTVVVLTLMIAIKENAENSESNYKLIFAMFFLVVIVIIVLAVALRL